MHIYLLFIFSFQVNLHIYGPQVIVASNTFCMDPTSKIAKETFENFCDMWRYLVNDVIQVAKEILESFKSFSLLGAANPAATPLKQQPAPTNRNYFNSVFQNNRDPFSSGEASLKVFTVMTVLVFSVSAPAAALLPPRPSPHPLQRQWSPGGRPRQPRQVLELETNIYTQVLDHGQGPD